MLGLLRRWENGLLLRSYIHQYLRWNRGADSFLNPNNSQFIEGMYNSWLKDPGSVGESWARYFEATGSPPKPKSAPALAKPSSLPSAQMSGALFFILYLICNPKSRKKVLILVFMENFGQSQKSNVFYSILCL